MRGFLAKSNTNEQVRSNDGKIVTSWIYQEGTVDDVLSAAEVESTEVFASVFDDILMTDDLPDIAVLVALTESITATEQLSLFVELTVDDLVYLIDRAVRKQKRIMYLLSTIPESISLYSTTASQMYLLSTIPSALSFSWDINLREWVEN